MLCRIKSLSFEKCIHSIFNYVRYSPHLFKPSIVLGSGIFSTYMYKNYDVLIDKSSQFCNTENKYEVAITCAFWGRLRMSTISTVPTCMAKMHRCAPLRTYMVLRYLMWVSEEKCSQQRALKPFFHPRASLPDPI